MKSFANVAHPQASPTKNEIGGYSTKVNLQLHKERDDL
jgi:hypothetical protein